MSRNRLLNVMRCVITSKLSFPIRSDVARSNHAWPAEATGAAKGNRANRDQSVRRAGAGGPVSDFGRVRLSALLDR